MITLLVYLLVFIIFLIIMSLIIFYGINYNSIKLTIWIISIVIVFLLIELLIESSVSLFLTYMKVKKAPQDSSKSEEAAKVLNNSQDEPEKSVRNTKNEYYLHMKNLFNQKIFKFNYQIRKQYELLNHKFSGLSHELYRQSIYLIALLLLIYGTRNALGYYSTNHNKKFLLNTRLNAMPLNQIYEDNDVWTFIENEFLPKTHEYKNGWIHGHVLKIIGVARLRQLRINNNSLHDDELNMYNEERKNYLPNWENFVSFRYGKYYWRILDPWKYRKGTESKTLPMHGTMKIYPSGGYICQLGRNMNNSLKITTFLRKSNWINQQTRVLFIEYTFYGVDANLFNVNTIIMEKTIYENYIVTVYIQTTNLLLIIEDTPIITIILFIVLIMLTLIFFMNLIRELLKNRHNFIYNLWNIIDLIIVIIISIMIIIYFVRNFYVHNLLRQMEKTRNNEFISFYYAALYDIILAYVGGLLICISTLRLWKILNYFEMFYALTKTLQRCMKSIAALTLIMCLCLMGYGLAVFVVNGSESILFFNFTKVLTTLTALSFGFNDGMPWNNFLYGGTTMGIILYFILLIEFNIFIMNMFVTVICYHLTLAKQEKQEKLYTLLEYSKDKLSKCGILCCKKYEKPEIKDQLNLINYNVEPIENEIPIIRGTLNNTAINAQIDYANELCDKIDWNNFESETENSDSETIPNYCGLTYRGRTKPPSIMPENKEYCGLVYRSTQDKNPYFKGVK